MSYALRSRPTAVADRSGLPFTAADVEALSSGLPIADIAALIGRTPAGVSEGRRRYGVADSMPQKAARHAERPLIGAVCGDHFIVGCDCRE